VENEVKPCNINKESQGKYVRELNESNTVKPKKNFQNSNIENIEDRLSAKKIDDVERNHPFILNPTKSYLCSNVCQKTTP
jgi:hypothetical protein